MEGNVTRRKQEHQIQAEHEIEWEIEKNQTRGSPQRKEGKAKLGILEN